MGSSVKQNKWLAVGVFVVFFVGVAIWNRQQPIDFDIWFHVKSGEIIAHQGIIHHDVFAYTTEGREWFPHEWLFELGMYWVHSVGGMGAVQWFSAFVVCGIGMLIYGMCRQFVRLPVLGAYGIVIIFLLSVSNFLTQRPQVWAQLFLLTLIYGFVTYIKKDTLYGLALGVGVTVVWANSHGSVFLAPLIGLAFLGWAVVLRDWKKVKFLGMTAVLVAGATILPPLGTLQYRMLAFIGEHASTINKFIDEWVPLSEKGGIYFWIYTASVVLAAGVFGWWQWKQKAFKESGWVWLLAPLAVTGYIASRNVFLGYVPISLMLAYALRGVALKKGWARWLVGGLGALYVIYMLISNAHPLPFSRYYPVQAADFLLEHHVNGNMFNDYGYGGYLLYKLYPGYRVFIDGRTDLYVCCEMPEGIDLALKKYKSDDEYKKDLDVFWDKHQISFAITYTLKNSLTRKMARILQNDPNWSLVYWDDVSEIFVRRDGKNDKIIADFGVLAATPFNQEPYRKGQEEQAWTEYKRMGEIVDSAKSRNTIGYLLLKKGEIEAARREFDQAVQLAAWEESAYMNLAEIAIHDGDVTKAIQLYRTAIDLAPDRGLGYIRLGQILVDQGNKIEATTVWSKGLQMTIDEDARVRLTELVKSNE